MLPSKRAPPAVIAGIEPRHVGDDRLLAGKDGDAADLGSCRFEKGVSEPQLTQQRHGGSREKLATHFAAWERRFLDDGNRPAGAREEQRRRRARRPSTDDDGVMPHASATNVCVKGPLRRSLSRHRGSRGQSAVNSRSRNPARTLTRASWRVTPLQPSNPSSDAPIAAAVDRRGSHAMKRLVCSDARPRSSKSSRSRK